MTIYIKETYLNRQPRDDGNDDTHIFGQSSIMPTDYEDDQRGVLYRSLQKEYGSCIGHVYVDTFPNGKEVASPNMVTSRVGWVFEMREEYTDSHDIYIKQVWVSLYNEIEEYAAW